MIGQDGQHVLVRNQSTWIRVHPCRLILTRDAERQIEETDTTTNAIPSPTTTNAIPSPKSLDQVQRDPPLAPLLIVLLHSPQD